MAGRRCDGGRDAHTGVNARRYPTPIRAGVSCWRARPGAAAITAAWLGALPALLLLRRARTGGDVVGEVVHVEAQETVV